MKKIATFIVIIIIIICVLGFSYQNYMTKKTEIEKNNLIYNGLYEKEISGNELATVINKTIDNNEKNNIKQNENGEYIENDTNSIKIEIKFKQSDKIFPIESIYSKRVSEFIRLYGQVKFKCTEIEYHKSTKFIKYLYFQEV